LEVQPALLGDRSAVAPLSVALPPPAPPASHAGGAAVAARQPLEYVAHGAQTDLRREGAEETSIRVADRDGQRDGGLRQPRVPVRVSDQRFAGPKPVQLVQRELHAAHAAPAARYHATTRVEQHQGVAIRGPVAHGVEIVAQPAERGGGGAPLDSG